jgi:hypothetical protein
MNAAVQPLTHAHLQSFLAFDFGLKRTGVAYASRFWVKPNLRAQ